MRRPGRSIGSVIVGLLAVVLVGPVAAAAREGRTAGRQTIRFDHRAGGSSASYHLRLRAGETFAIEIANTAPPCFDYPIEGVSWEPDRNEISQAITLQTETLEQRHDERYGGYILRITKKSGRPPECDRNAAGELQEATLIVAVETQGIVVGFGGGFTFSDLTNPAFGSRTNEAGEEVIVVDPGAEDEFSLGVGTFVHIYGKGWPRGVPSLAFGLGIGDQSSATYYFGPFWRLGKQAFVGFGAIFGPVERLPTGVRVGDPVPGGLNFGDLPTKTDVGLFFGLSYSFLGGSGEAALGKPFLTRGDGE